MGMKAGFDKGIILVRGQDFNHQEETGSDQSSGKHPEKYMKMTRFHLVTKWRQELGQSKEVKFRDERWQKTHLCTSEL